MSTAEIVAGVLNSEMVVMVCAVLLVAGVALYLEYIIRRWSWIPRREQRRVFGERFERGRKYV